MNRRILSCLCLLLPGLLAARAAEAGAPEATETLLLVRGDDMGTSQAANEACVRAYREGIVRSTEVVAPGPWFLDAVRLLRENPGLDVGVHLCLTSEWENCKWRPLTCAPSLTDSNGYFFPMTAQRKDFPPNTGFLEARPDPAEVERELRAQIELTRRHIRQVTHLSSHMGTATATPPFRAIVQKLAREYRLRLEDQRLKSARGFRGNTPAEREASLLDLVGKLQPGAWLLVEHPGADTPEMRGLGHVGYYGVAAERAAVTAAFTSPAVKRLIQDRQIKLIGYGDLGAP